MLGLGDGPTRCRRCGDVALDPPRGGADAGLLCHRCGTVLVAESLSARVLEKLAHVTRMGLRGRDVLLRPGPGREER
jgi:hypothetical protein